MKQFGITDLTQTLCFDWTWINSQKLSSPLSITPGYALPWESSGDGWEYPSSFAPPLQVAIEASDGASDYGNKFGEPVLSGREPYWNMSTLI